MTPDVVVRDTVRALETAERDIITLIKRRLSYGQNVPAWATHRLAETRDLLTEVRVLLADTLPGQATVDEFLQEAWRVGVDWADRDLAAVQTRLTTSVAPNLPVPTVGQSRVPRQLLALMQESNTALQGLPTVMLRSTADVYRQAVLEAVTRQATGTVSLGEAVKQVTDRLAQSGIRGFVDRSGRQWRASTYARMALRTAYSRAANDARLGRYTDRGVRLVIVSDAYRECPLCRPWEGAVLTIGEGVAPDGVSVAGSVADARAAGLQHPGCRHLLNAYVPGLTRRPVNPDPQASSEVWPPAA